MDDTSSNSRLLTGDTPTGKLHLGHLVGSLENRLRLQSEYECFFIIANKHAFVNKAEQPQEIRQSVIDVATDWLAVGIDPKRSAMFIQSEVPVIDELTFYFAMLLPFNRVMRNPTLKDELRDKGLGDSYSFGFPLYALGRLQIFLRFGPSWCPLGRISFLTDPQHIEAGGLFPVFEPLIGRVERLMGTGGPGPDGRLLKMSKSLGNAIFLSDESDVVRQKVMNMYTDPKRLKATDPGQTEDNPVWMFHDAFNPDNAWVESTKQLYREGGIGDVVVKKKLVEVLNEILEPIRQRRRGIVADPSYVVQSLKAGTERACAVAEETMSMAKGALKQNYF